MRCTICQAQITEPAQARRWGAFLRWAHIECIQNQRKHIRQSAELAEVLAEALTPQDDPRP